MSDAAIAEAASVQGGLVAAETGPAKPAFSMAGYCSDCGTWDTHGLSCNACGYDFGGAKASAANE